MEAQRIIALLRVDSDTDIANLIEKDAEPIMRRLIAAADRDAARMVVTEHLAQVYAACAAAISNEHRMRVAASLDAAHDRAEITQMIRELQDRGDALLEGGTRLGELAAALIGQSQECYRIVTELGVWRRQERGADAEGSS